MKRDANKFTSEMERNLTNRRSKIDMKTVMAAVELNPKFSWSALGGLLLGFVM